ncbi:hypothetical protein GYMLUDRAFT_383004 [Collybiopsis luxurians FD-317 M1]|nr:hypothetical protein GYMLUDRAFT_383004 [Collybiopsis luxurians FD-317 M1]
MLLPDELLLFIIEHIAFILGLPNSNFKSQFKHVSPELLALSVVNRRMRRICLPLLFANIHIRNVEDAEKLRDHYSLCSTFTKTLKLAIREEKGQNILCQVLPNLKRLSYVDSNDCDPNLALLQAILEHPTVSAVLVHDLPAGCFFFSLSKMVLNETVGFPEPVEGMKGFLDRGMKIAGLRLYDPHLLNESFGLQTLEGLQEVILILSRLFVPFTWLPALTEAHPHLRKLCLRDERQLYFVRHSPPFIGHFIEECRRRELNELFDIKEVGLSRAVSQPDQQGWHVTRIILIITSRGNSLTELLRLIASSFPELESLSLDFTKHDSIYPIDDIVDALCSFSHLRYLYLYQIFKRLEARHEEPLERLNSYARAEEVRASIEADLL